MGNELRGKTVGIIGTGAIGSRVAELCRAFGCRTIGYGGFSEKESSKEMTYFPFEELLGLSDIITLHCPATEKSIGLIDKDALEYMKESAILINAARGPIVDSEALADALNNGVIAGAGVDVFETEPPLDKDHPLLHAKNIIVTPHVAFATKESMKKRAAIVFDTLDKWLRGTQVNKII